MIKFLELWRLVIKIGITFDLNFWLIRDEDADYCPLVSFGYVHEYFPEFNDKVVSIQLIFLFLYFSIGIKFDNSQTKENDHV